PTGVAIRTIEEQNPFVTVQEVPEDTAVTTDFRCDRVRIFRSPSDGSDTSPLLVTRAPSVGRTPAPGTPSPGPARPVRREKRGPSASAARGPPRPVTRPEVPRHRRRGCLPPYT